MLSDGRVIPHPLKKMSCQTCGYGYHQVPPTRDYLRDIFDEEYSLGQRDPDAETARAEHYATVIEHFLKDNMVPSPRHLIEPGCGMGSLLSLLAQRWECETAWGVEPSKRLVDAARDKNESDTEIWQGFAEDIAEVHEGRFDLCLSINVIEHTLSPADFLDVCRKITHPDGHVLVVCPDGETPSLELLFYDHISSFTRPALGAFARRVGLEIVAAQILDGPLLGFQMLLLKRSCNPVFALRALPQLEQRRADFLKSWQQSAQHLAEMLDARAYALFGAGEFADLLKAYCPQIIENAQSVVVDTPFEQSYLGKPLISTEVFLKDSDCVLVAAVNVRSWLVVQERFMALGKDIYHPQLSFLDGQSA